MNVVIYFGTNWQIRSETVVGLKKKKMNCDLDDFRNNVKKKNFRYFQELSDELLRKIWSVCRYVLIMYMFSVKIILKSKADVRS